MGIIPLHLQRRFEQRWAARFGSLVIPPVPKNVGLKGSPVNMLLCLPDRGRSSVAYLRETLGPPLTDGVRPAGLGPKAKK